MNVTNHKQRQKINFLFRLRMISVAIVMCAFLLFFRFANYRRMCYNQPVFAKCSLAVHRPVWYVGTSGALFMSLLSSDRLCLTYIYILFILILLYILLLLSIGLLIDCYLSVVWLATSYRFALIFQGLWLAKWLAI